MRNINNYSLFFFFLFHYIHFLFLKLKKGGLQPSLPLPSSGSANVV